MASVKKPVTVSINEATRGYDGKGWLTNATQCVLATFTLTGATYTGGTGTTFSATLTIPRDAHVLSVASGTLASTCTLSVQQYVPLSATWVTVPYDLDGVAYPKASYPGGKVLRFPVSRLSNQFRVHVRAHQQGRARAIAQDRDHPGLAYAGGHLEAEVVQLPGQPLAGLDLLQRQLRVGVEMAEQRLQVRIIRGHRLLHLVQGHGGLALLEITAGELHPQPRPAAHKVLVGVDVFLHQRQRPASELGAHLQQLASAGLPPSSGFVAEWLLLQSFLFLQQILKDLLYWFKTLELKGFAPVLQRIKYPF